jgi:hypothetical protein
MKYPSHESGLTWISVGGPGKYASKREVRPPLGNWVMASHGSWRDSRGKRSLSHANLDSRGRGGDWIEMLSSLLDESSSLPF